MTERTITNPRLRRLLSLLLPKWRHVAERSAMLFLAGGGLLLVSATLFTVQVVTPLSMEGVLTGVTGFLGILLSYIGVLGLYPWFVTRTPRLAHAGVVLVALPTIVIAVLLLWGVATHLPVGAVPAPMDVLPGIGRVLVATFLLFAAGAGVFGGASLRTGIPSRTTGVLLLGFAVIWVVLLGASLVYGSRFPAWLDALMLGMMAIALLAIGQSLRAESGLIARTKNSFDTAK